MLPGQTYSLDRILRILRKRWWMLAAPLAAGVAAGALAYRMMPLQYRSDTLILAMPQRVPEEYVKSTVTTDIVDRLRSVRELIMSRSQLGRIIQQFDLYKEMRQTAGMEEVLKRMAGDIDVELLSTESSFRVSYVSANPVTAQQVTEALAGLFIDENREDRNRIATDTSSFLETQLQEAKAQLVAQEKKLEEYRRQHSGELPTQVPANLQAMQNAQMQVQALTDSMNRARERRLLIERQIADTESMPVEVSLASSGPASALPVAQQLELARGKLDDLNQRYTPDHPDVLAQQQLIKDLQAKASVEARSATNGGQVERPTSSVEIARQKRLSDLRAEQEVIDLQIKSADAEAGRMRATIAELSAKIQVLPTRESELTELTRDYGTLQKSYTDLLQKSENSKIAVDLEKMHSGAQFRILDPASLPERPWNEKKRLAVLAGGPVAGFALGLFVLGFLEYRDDTFQSEEDVIRVLSLPVLAMVPAMQEGTSHSTGGHGKRAGLADRS